jgi:hypothetical protein
MKDSKLIHLCFTFYCFKLMLERKSGSLEAELRLRIFMDAYGQRVTGMCTSAM